MNYKILTLFLALCVVFLSVVLYLDYKETKEIYKFGDIEIEKQKLDSLADAVNTDSFILCDIPQGKCIKLFKNT